MVLSGRGGLAKQNDKQNVDSVINKDRTKQWRGSAQNKYVLKMFFILLKRYVSDDG